MSGPSAGQPVPPQGVPDGEDHGDEETHEREEDPEASEPEPLTLEEAKKLYENSKRYVDNGYRVRWDNYFRIYSGERVDQSYYGTISVSNREPHTIIETLVANIAGGLPKFHFIPTNEEQNRDTQVLNGILDYYLEFNEMNQKNQIWVRDMLTYGTGILHVAWRDGKPWIENIAIRDFFFDESATGLVKTISPAQYAGFEYLIMKDQLEAQQIYDADEKKWVSKYENLEKIGDIPNVNGDVGEMDKRFKDLFNGSTIENAPKDQVHVVILYHLPTGRIYEIGNQREFIYNRKSHLQREEETRDMTVLVEGVPTESKQRLDEICPFLPFAVLRDYIDPSLFLGEGEMAVIAGDAELLNDYESMDADNAAYQTTPMFTIDPQFADMAPEIETIPGAVYPVPAGALKQIEMAQTGEQLALKKNEVVDRMRRGTAADEAVQGVSQQQGRITATEVATQVQQAQGRFSTKLTNMGSGGYAQLGSVIFKMMQIFLKPADAIRIVGKDGVEFKNFDPWEYNGEYEPGVELDQQIKQQEMEVGQKLNQLYTVMAQSPVYDPIEIQRFFVMKMDPKMTDEKFNQMLAKPAPPIPPAPRDFVDLDKLYALAEISTKQEILKMIGLPEAPELAAKAQTELITHASTQADLLNPTTDTNGNPLVDAMGGMTDNLSQ